MCVCVFVLPVLSAPSSTVGCAVAVQQSIVAIVIGGGVQTQAAAGHPGRLDNRRDPVLVLKLQY